MKKKYSRAEPFIATRNHHILETLEDYVEIVADLISEKGEARTCDIANHLGISHVTAVRVIDRLKKKGYLLSEQHRPITLTEEGRKLARFCKERHSFLLEYLETLGVSKLQASIDVEGIEHHVSPETLSAFKQHHSMLTKPK